MEASLTVTAAVEIFPRINHGNTMQPAVLAGLTRRDRALFVLCADHAKTRAAWRVLWTLLTHLGGATSAILSCLVPPALEIQLLEPAARDALRVLIISHVIVQVIKRYVRRPRPSVSEAWDSVVHEPDKFSFPSGHSAAAMAVAFVYAAAFPAVGPMLLGIALLVGASRVFLGVHYPGDVLAGILIALVTAVVFL